MSDGATFTIVFAIIFAGIPYVYYRLRQFKRKETLTIKEDRLHFDQAVYWNDIIEIKRLGLDLVWNSHAGIELLAHIEAVIDARIERHPSLKEVQEAIAKKRANWETTSFGWDSWGDI